jgi:tRNA1Val (adenine37-N6)-methyltransferase
LWPYAAHEAFRGQACLQGLYLQARLLIRDRPGSRINRAVGVYAAKAGEPGEHELIIKRPDGSYTDDFIRLMAPFYLNL